MLSFLRSACCGFTDAVKGGATCGRAITVHDDNSNTRRSSDEDRVAILRTPLRCAPSWVPQPRLSYSCDPEAIKQTTRLVVDHLKGHTFVNQYLIIANLGKGAHGTVKLVYNTHDDMLYAMKVIKRKTIGGVQKPSSAVQPREQGQALRTQLSIACQHRRAMMMQRSSPGAAPEERGIPSSDPGCFQQAHATLTPLPQPPCSEYEGGLSTGGAQPGSNSTRRQRHRPSSLSTFAPNLMSMQGHASSTSRLEEQLTAQPSSTLNDPECDNWIMSLASPKPSETIMADQAAPALMSRSNAGMHPPAIERFTQHAQCSIHAVPSCCSLGQHRQQSAPAPLLAAAGSGGEPSMPVPVNSQGGGMTYNGSESDLGVGRTAAGLLAATHPATQTSGRLNPCTYSPRLSLSPSPSAALGMQPFPLDMEIEVMKELNHSNVVQLFEVIRDQGSSLDDVWLLDSMHDALLRRQSGPEDGLGAGSAASNVIQQTSAHRLATSTSCQHLATAGSSSSKLADSKLVMVLVMEYVEGGCVMQGEGALPEDLARRYFRDILKGLEYLHYNTIVHGDLKPDNLLINLAGQVKISDFGSARLCHPGALLTGSYGTPVIMAPEQCTGKAYDGYCSDMWALGVCLYTFVTGKFPFPAAGRTAFQVYDAIQNQPLRFPIDSPRLSQDVISLITSLLEKDSSKRANLEMVMTHPWVTCKGTLPVLEFSGQRAVQKVLERISGPGRLAARSVHQQQPSPSGSAGVPMATNCALQHLLRSPHVQQKHYEDGQVILRQGDQCKGLFFVISGECEVVYSAKPKGGAVDADEDFQDVLEETRVDTSSSSGHSSGSSNGKATDSSSSPHAPVCDSPVIPASKAPQTHETFAAAALTNMQRISDISMSQHAGKLLSYNHANGSSSTQLSGLEVYPASLPEHQVSYLQSRFQCQTGRQAPTPLHSNIPPSLTPSATAGQPLGQARNSTSRQPANEVSSCSKTPLTASSHGVLHADEPVALTQFPEMRLLPAVMGTHMEPAPAPPQSPQRLRRSFSQPEHALSTPSSPQLREAKPWSTGEAWAQLQRPLQLAKGMAMGREPTMPAVGTPAGSVAVPASGPLQLTAVQPAVEEAAAQSTTSQTRLNNARLTASAPTHQKSQRHQHAVNNQAKPHAQRGTAQASDSHYSGSATRYKVLRSVVSSPATPPGHVPSEVHPSCMRLTGAAGHLLHAESPFGLPHAMSSSTAHSSFQHVWQNPEIRPPCQSPTVSKKWSELAPSPAAVGSGGNASSPFRLISQWFPSIPASPSPSAPGASAASAGASTAAAARHGGEAGVLASVGTRHHWTRAASSHALQPDNVGLAAQRPLGPTLLSPAASSPPCAPPSVHWDPMGSAASSNNTSALLYASLQRTSDLETVTSLGIRRSVSTAAISQNMLPLSYCHSLLTSPPASPLQGLSPMSQFYSSQNESSTPLSSVTGGSPPAQAPFVLPSAARRVADMALGGHTSLCKAAILHPSNSLPTLSHLVRPKAGLQSHLGSHDNMPSSSSSVRATLGSPRQHTRQKLWPQATRTTELDSGGNSHGRLSDGSPIALPIAAWPAHASVSSSGCPPAIVVEPQRAWGDFLGARMAGHTTIPSSMRPTEFMLPVQVCTLQRPTSLQLCRSRDAAAQLNNSMPNLARHAEVNFASLASPQATGSVVCPAALAAAALDEEQAANTARMAAVEQAAHKTEAQLLASAVEDCSLKRRSLDSSHLHILATQSWATYSSSSPNLQAFAATSETAAPRLAGLCSPRMQAQLGLSGNFHLLPILEHALSSIAETACELRPQRPSDDPPGQLQSRIPSATRTSSTAPTLKSNSHSHGASEAQAASFTMDSLVVPRPSSEALMVQEARWGPDLDLDLCGSKPNTLLSGSTALTDLGVSTESHAGEPHSSWSFPAPHTHTQQPSEHSGGSKQGMQLPGPLAVRHALPEQWQPHSSYATLARDPPGLPISLGPARSLDLKADTAALHLPHQPSRAQSNLNRCSQIGTAAHPSTIAHGDPGAAGGSAALNASGSHREVLWGVTIADVAEAGTALDTSVQPATNNSSFRCLERLEAASGETQQEPVSGAPPAALKELMTCHYPAAAPNHISRTKYDHPAAPLTTHLPQLPEAEAAAAVAPNVQCPVKECSASDGDLLAVGRTELAGPIRSAAVAAKTTLTMLTLHRQPAETAPAGTNSTGTAAAPQHLAVQYGSVDSLGHWSSSLAAITTLASALDRQGACSRMATTHVSSSKPTGGTGVRDSATSRHTHTWPLLTDVAAAGHRSSSSPSLQPMPATLASPSTHTLTNAARTSPVQGLGSPLLPDTRPGNQQAVGGAAPDPHPQAGGMQWHSQSRSGPWLHCLTNIQETQEQGAAGFHGLGAKHAMISSSLSLGQDGGPFFGFSRSSPQVGLDLLSFVQGSSSGALAETLLSQRCSSQARSQRVLMGVGGHKIPNSSSKQVQLAGAMPQQLVPGVSRLYEQHPGAATSSSPCLQQAAVGAGQQANTGQHVSTGHASPSTSVSVDVLALKNQLQGSSRRLIAALLQASPLPWVKSAPRLATCSVAADFHTRPDACSMSGQAWMGSRHGSEANNIIQDSVGPVLSGGLFMPGTPRVRQLRKALERTDSMHRRMAGMVLRAKQHAYRLKHCTSQGSSKMVVSLRGPGSVFGVTNQQGNIGSGGLQDATNQASVIARGLVQVLLIPMDKLAHYRNEPLVRAALNKSAVALVVQETLERFVEHEAEVKQIETMRQVAAQQLGLEARAEEVLLPAAMRIRKLSNLQPGGQSLQHTPSLPGIASSSR